MTVIRQSQIAQITRTLRPQTRFNGPESVICDKVRTAVRDQATANGRINVTKAGDQEATEHSMETEAAHVTIKPIIGDVADRIGTIAVNVEIENRRTRYAN